MRRTTLDKEVKRTTVITLDPGQTMFFFGRFYVSIATGSRGKATIDTCYLRPGEPKLLVTAPFSGPAACLSCSSVSSLPAEVEISVAPGPFPSQHLFINPFPAGDSPSAKKRRAAEQFLLKNNLHEPPVCAFDPDMKGIYIVTKEYLDQFASCSEKVCVPLFYLPTDWQACANDLSNTVFSTIKPQVYAILGPRGVGKSTFARYVCNTLLAEGNNRNTPLESVLWLDCDAGQPEFTPSGLVSLYSLKAQVHGPQFAHTEPKDTQGVLEKAFFVGSSTYTSDVSFYVRCIRSLIAAATSLQDKAHIEGRLLPLVVNFCGVGGDLGCPLALTLLNILVPTQTIVIESSTLRHSPLQEILTNHNHKYISISSFDQDSVNSKELVHMSPRQRREAAFLSYFGDHSVPLLRAPSYRVPFSSLAVQVYSDKDGFWSPETAAAQSHNILSILNGRVVAICQSQTVAAQFHNLKETRAPAVVTIENRGGLCPLWECKGLGVVRNVDRTTCTVHIVTPAVLCPAEGPLVLITSTEMQVPGTVAPVTWMSSRDSLVAAPYVAAGETKESVSGTEEMKRTRQSLLKMAVINK